MTETFERGKKYEVKKEWSNPGGFPIANVRSSLAVGEVLRFRGPNFTGAEFVDKDGKLVFLPVKVAFRIMGNLTQRAVDRANAPRLFGKCDCGEVEPLCTCGKSPRN